MLFLLSWDCFIRPIAFGWGVYPNTAFTRISSWYVSYCTCRGHGGSAFSSKADAARSYCWTAGGSHPGDKATTDPDTCAVHGQINYTSTGGNTSYYTPCVYKGPYFSSGVGDFVKIATEIFFCLFVCCVFRFRISKDVLHITCLKLWSCCFKIKCQKSPSTKKMI